jgi:DNA-binding transcriptional LysR family regulator
VRHLRAFVTLADVGRITAAARTLGLAQSTVSEAIAALERSLGTPVILRTPRGRKAELTPAGRALLPHARGILEAVANARLAVAARTTATRARVDIIANESISTYLLPAAIAGLHARWPNTRCSVSIGTCTAVRQGVANGAFDLGLMLDARNSRARQRRPVSDEIRLVVFSKPLHPLTRRRAANTPIAREDLTAYPLFTSDAAGDFHAALRRWFGASRAGGPGLEAAGSVEGVKQAVAVGADTLGILPAYAIDDEVKKGVFATLAVRPAPPRLRLTVLFSTVRVRHPAAEELLGRLAGYRRDSRAGVTASRPRSTSVGGFRR